MNTLYNYSLIGNESSSSSENLEMTSLQNGAGPSTADATADYGIQMNPMLAPQRRRTNRSTIHFTRSTVISLFILVPIGLAAFVIIILLATGVVNTTTLGVTKVSVTPAPFITCKDTERRCDNGYECLPLKYVCDGNEDCSDNSDERGCEGGCQMSTTLYYHCKNGDCIKKQWQCDREADCVDKDDEVGCEKCDSAVEFTCNNYDCIALESRCDGVYDCRDKSDEYGCFRHDSDTIKYLYNITSLDLCYNSYTQTAAGRICALLGHRYEGASSLAIPRDDNSALAVNIHPLPSSDSNGTFEVTVAPTCNMAVNLRCQACGESTKVIGAAYLVGGEGGFPISQWPWHVKLSIGNRICGGTIIASRWILTAAHCVSSASASEVKVVYGTNKFNGEGGVEKKTIRIILHPKFKANVYRQHFTTYSYDMALLEVSALQYNSKAQPACLPTQDDILTKYTNCYITGFGSIVLNAVKPIYPTVLQEGKTRVVGRSQCEKSYHNAYGLGVEESWLCAGYNTAGVDSCGGDSGGPLVCLTNRRWVLQGVVSWGSTCKQALPSIYSKVSMATDWINEYINS